MDTGEIIWENEVSKIINSSPAIVNHIGYVGTGTQDQSLSSGLTIDEHEVFHLGMLLEELFPEAARQMVTVVITPGGVTQDRFSRVEEYAIYCFMPNAMPSLSQDDMLSNEDQNPDYGHPSFWESLLRRGEGSQREDRPGIEIHPRCEKLIEEIDGLVYKQNKNDETTDEKPFKKDDHSPDALRYLSMGAVGRIVKQPIFYVPG